MRFATATTHTHLYMTLHFDCNDTPNLVFMRFTKTASIVRRATELLEDAHIVGVYYHAVKTRITQVTQY